MGIWIELGVFLLVFVFAAWQFHDLKREKLKRLAREAEAARQSEAMMESGNAHSDKPKVQQSERQS